MKYKFIIDFNHLLGSSPPGDRSSPTSVSSLSSSGDVGAKSADALSNAGAKSADAPGDIGAKSADALCIEEMTSADFFVDGRAHFSVHEELLKDVSKARAFQDAILGNPQVDVADGMLV